MYKGEGEIEEAIFCYWLKVEAYVDWSVCQNIIKIGKDVLKMMDHKV